MAKKAIPKASRGVTAFISGRWMTAVCSEDLESRRLFSGFTITSLYALDDTVGRSVQSAPVLDSAGDLFDLTSAGGANSDGAVFEVPAGQRAASVLHSFTPGTDPSTSYGNLVIDAAGNLYGTSYAGGANQTGSIFEIPVGGAYSTLYSFPDAPGIGTVLLSEVTLYQTPIISGSSSTLDFFGATSMGGDSGAGAVYEVTDANTITGQQLVAFPANYGVIGSGVTRDSDGDIFGTSTSGGTDNSGSIWEVPVGGGLFFLRASFTGADGSDPQGPMLWDPKAQAFFGTTRFGGADNDGTLFEFANGIITTLASFDGLDGQGPQGNLVEDSAGDLFGTTVDGGLGSLGSVFELPAGSSTIVSVGSFDGMHNGQNPIGGLVADGLGDYYGVTSSGGTNNDGVVYELSPQPPSQLAFAIQPTTAVTAQPFSITVDVEDTTGSPVISDSSLVTLSLASGTAGALTGTLTANAVHGVANFNDVILNTAGVYAIAATDGTLVGAVTNSISVSLPPDHVVIASQPQSTLTSTVLPTISVGVENSNKDQVISDQSNVTLTIASGPANATISGTTTVPAANGLATFSNLSFSSGGQYTLQASDGSLVDAVSTPFIISPPGPHLMFVQQPTDGVAGIKITNAVTVELLGADDTLESTARPTSVSLLVTNPAGKITRITGVARAGIATFKNFTFKVAGTYFFSATSGKTFTAENSDPFTIAPNITRKVVVITSPPLVAGVSMPFVVQAKLVDIYGNTNTSDDSPLTIVFSKAQKLALLDGDTTEDAIDGIVTFDDLSITAAGKSLVLRIVDGKLQTTTRPFTAR
jgi:uncharacterized repeat protein (TIGR03803 family)